MNDLRTVFPGQKLPNGATLLLYKSNRNGEGVVLAWYQAGFVTWRTYRHEADSCCHGHYVAPSENWANEAALEFAERS